jgi:predicted nucleic-acid-binding protein
MPLAVDTNVLARALVDDGSEQARRSRILLSEKEVFVPDSVLLETEWLLRSLVRLDRNEINQTFATLDARVWPSFDAAFKRRAKKIAAAVSVTTP